MSSTGISLNERFTVLADKKSTSSGGARGQGRVRSRSRSRTRQIVTDPVNTRKASVTNLRLLNELKRKHAVQTAMKLKRRSLRTATNGIANYNKRVGVRSLRLAPNGRPIRTNSVTRMATMRADLVPDINSNRGNRGLRRTNSQNNILRRNNNNNNIGQRRPVAGGAAERIAKRRFLRDQPLQRGRSVQRRLRTGNGVGLHQQQQQQQQQQQLARRGRSRSRSRGPDNRARSLSRGRAASRTRSNVRQPQLQRQNLRAGPRVPIKDRLGVRPGGPALTFAGNRPRGRRPSSNTRGVANGRVQKRAINVNNLNAQKAVVVRGGRARGRSAVREAVNAGATRRSRSRTRKVAAGVGQRLQLGSVGKGGGAGKQIATGGRNARLGGRSQQHRGRGGGVNGGNGVRRNGNKQQNQKLQPQAPQLRRGRSRSRGRGRVSAGGKNQRMDIKKEDLDNELDQYMATTKTDMDYLLK